MAALEVVPEIAAGHADAAEAAGVCEPAEGSDTVLRDSFGRRIVDLRVSVTDRCNYRCVYCRDTADGEFGELSIAEYARMVRVFVSLGIEKVRLTGGEPLLRAGLLDLIAEVSAMRTPAGVRPEIALTTNGHLLEGMASALNDAGLDRVTVSMDAVEPETFARITRVPGSYSRVVAGVRAAQAAGLGPVKVNAVLMRGFNDDQVEGFGEFARREGVVVRFIEFMPLEEGRVWSPEIVVREAEIVERLGRAFGPMTLLPANHASETARRYGFADGVGEVGVIAPVSRPFCGHCSRIRLTSDGRIRTCLFSQTEHDLSGELKRGASDDALRTYIHSTVQRKEARHHIGEEGFLRPSRNMVHIGG